MVALKETRRRVLRRWWLAPLLGYVRIGVGNLSGQTSGRSFVESYAHQLFDLDDRCRSIHRTVWSLRGFLLIPGFFRREDLASHVAELSVLSWELTDSGESREAEYPGDLKKALDEYHTALQPTIDLLGDFCRMLDREIYRGAPIPNSERNRKTLRYSILWGAAFGSGWLIITMGRCAIPPG